MNLDIMRAAGRFLVLTALAGVIAGPVLSQPGRPTTPVALGPMVMIHTFSPDDRAVTARFRLDQAIPGIAYSGPGTLISFARGVSADRLDGVETDLEFMDFTFRLRSDLARLVERGRLKVSVPILLVSTYRRVRAEQGRVTTELFEHTAAGVGSGVGLTVARRSWQMESRATPAIGFATRSFGNSIGRFLAMEWDTSVSIPRLAGRFGLSVGYGYGWQQWHVSGIEALVASGADKIDYSGIAHTVRMGLAW